MKEPHGVPFPPNKQYAKNILKIVKCSECAKCRVLYARIKLKLDDQDKVKKPLKNHICISFVDIHKNPMAYDRENISFSVPIETTYYGTGFPDICVYCGTSKNLRKGGKEFFPQCNCCTGNRMKIRKRKLNENMLKGAKTKKL